ncbi:hypothetical protein L3Y34_008964 [Caenorhabditis briggsae]|uniref:Uncharacterized protein n=1 Tax=Caenorhabditis briggsae TaxID=6238 RepID=A0AAE9A451_CAEBR|nr:hypothetical protein L3Y34_008964 [Caenorhabditis briggsae]
MANSSSTNISTILSTTVSLTRPTSPATSPATMASTITNTIIDATVQYGTTKESGSLIREGAGVAQNAMYVAMFILLGLCVLLCIVSSICWCWMKHRQDNKFNDFMNQKPEQEP